MACQYSAVTMAWATTRPENRENVFGCGIGGPTLALLPPSAYNGLPYLGH